MQSPVLNPSPVENFISRWTAREGGAERANYQMFLSELCDVLEVRRPDPAGTERELNDYVFERAVRPRDSDGTTAPKRIDLYRKNAFILEAKQSRLPGKKNALPGQLSMLADEPAALGRRSIAKGWDVMMKNARQQAESYVFLLDADHPAPPFLIVCDVGHCFELYADFTGTGRAYGYFPDRNGFRIYLEDLRDENVRALLKRIWEEPHSLDPTKESARVTRDIAKRLAHVSKALEERGFHAEDVAHFLMRCIFTMFAEDVELLPEGAFTQLLKDCIDNPDAFAPLLEELWAKMDEPQHERRFYSLFKKHLRHFNGNLFKQARAFPIGREEIGELWEASKARWTEVDPAIFGTLLEQALDKTERRKLGAHYTPRAYVQRLVAVTVMEPLRDDWQSALKKAEQATDDGDEKAAIAAIRAFHHQLCATRVLDPACGTGNFLYVALEMMKKLEGEVLETLAQLGEPESMGLDRETVDPHQFLGLELNPRAAAIAELVVWIGYLQQHYRTRTGHPSEPILRAFENINFGRREGYDAVLTWDGYPLPHVAEKDGKRIETYPNARRPEWPEAEFIVGNPPFIGNKRMREWLGSEYVSALRSADKGTSQSADFVMHWWERAADILSSKSSNLQRFGLVTTNSITQSFNRRVIEKHLNSGALSIKMAIPNHPWTKADRSSAAVRIAMTVADRNVTEGILMKVVHEDALDTDEPLVMLNAERGLIAANLEAGANTSATATLIANEDLSHQGIIPVGEGFRIEKKEIELLGYDLANLPHTIKPYAIGRDLVQRTEEKFIIDLFGLTANQARRDYPDLFQLILERVKPQRDLVNRQKTRENFWIYAEPRTRMRAAISGLPRYIGTCRTAKHRIFSFLPSRVLADAKIIAIALDDAQHLAILSSRFHIVWATRTGAWLGVGDDSNYNHSDCFAKFPFPIANEKIETKLRAIGEELDATRKKVQTEHPDLTLTGLYNVLDKFKIGVALDPRDEDIKRRGLILILKQLHEEIDQLTAQAYGWPDGLTDEEILERLVALNAERAKEEAAGHVRWLRPDYQIPRFAKAAAPKTGEMDLSANVVSIDQGKPTFPKDRYEQPLAVEAILLSSGRPMDAAELARGFKSGGRKIEPRVEQVLTTLARYGRITATGDGRYLARKAA